MLVRFFIAALAALLVPCALALAQTQVWKGPNGGQMVDAGAFHVELTVKGTEYNVHVYDHVDSPIAVAQATAVLTVMVGETREKVTMQPVAANQLAGKVEMKRSGMAKVLVLLRVPDQATAMARFDVP